MAPKRYIFGLHMSADFSQIHIKCQVGFGGAPKPKELKLDSPFSNGEFYPTPIFALTFSPSPYLFLPNP